MVCAKKKVLLSSALPFPREVVLELWCKIVKKKRMKVPVTIVSLW